MPLSPEQQQREAERLVATRQREQEKAAAAQAKQAHQEQQTALEAGYRAQGMTPWTGADGNLYPDPLFEQKQAAKAQKEQEKAAKEAADAAAKQARAEAIRSGRRHQINPVDGTPIYLESEQAVQQRQQDAAEQLRKSQIDDQIKAAQAVHGAKVAEYEAQGLKPLSETARKNLSEKGLAKARNDALFALQSHYQTLAKGTDKAGWWDVVNNHATPEAQAAQEALTRLQQPDAEPTDDDLAVLAANEATRPLVDKYRKIQERLSKDDELQKFHAEHNTRLADLTLRRDARDQWAESVLARRAQLPPDQLRAELDASSSDIEQRAASIQQQAAQLNGALAAHQLELDTLSQEAADRRSAGIPAGEIVTYDLGDGTTEAWPRDLAAQREQITARLQDTQAQQADAWALLKVQQEEWHRDAALHNETIRQQETRQQTRQQQQIDALRSRLQFTPGMEQTAKDLDAIRGDAEVRRLVLDDMYPDGIPDKALEALNADVNAKAEQTIQAGKSRFNSALHYYADIRTQLAENPALNATAGDLFIDARQKLAQDAGISEAEARRLLADAEALDWDQATADEMNKGLVAESWKSAKNMMQPEDARKTRILSNGSVIVHPRLSSEKDYKEAVQSSNASPEAKQDALDRYPEIRAQQARQTLETIQHYQKVLGEDATWKAWEAKRPKDVTPEEWALQFTEKNKAATEGPLGSMLAKTKQFGTGLLQSVADLISQASALGAGILGSNRVTRGIADQELMGFSQRAANSAAALSEQKAIYGQTSDTFLTRGVFDQLPRIAGSLLPAAAGSKIAMGATRLFAATKLGARFLPSLAAAVNKSADMGQMVKAVDTLRRVGMAGAATAGGAQTYAAQLGDIYTRLRKDHPEMTHAEALQQAQMPALYSGLATSLIMLTFGPKGIERFLTRPQEAKELAAKIFTSRMQQIGFVGKEFVKGGAWETLEEGPDEAISQMLAAAATAKPGQENAAAKQALAEFFQQLPDLAVATGILGGLGHGVAAIQDSSVNRNRSHLPETAALAWDAIENHVAIDAAGNVDAALTDQQQRRASLALSLAQGGELFDVEEADLNAAGWTRDGDQFKPLKDYTGPQVLDIDKGGLPVIKDSYIAALRNHGLAAVADAIGMSETETRNRHAQSSSASQQPAGQNQPGPQQPQPGPAQGAAPDAVAGTNQSPVQNPPGQGPQPSPGGQPAPQPGTPVNSRFASMSDAELASREKSYAAAVSANPEHTGIQQDLDDVRAEIARRSGFPAPTVATSATQDVQIDNIDSLIKNGGGVVQVSQGGRKVSYDKFGLGIDGNEAEVAFVELNASERGKGIGIKAYIALGMELAARGITLRSSGAQYADGRKMWKKLVSQGFAEVDANGKYRFTASQGARTSSAKSGNPASSPQDQPSPGGQPAPQSGSSVNDAGTPARNGADAPTTVSDTLANHLVERGLPDADAKAAAAKIVDQPEFAGMSYEQIIAEGPKFRAALTDLGIDGSLNSKDVATNPLTAKPGSKLAKVKAEMEAKAAAAGQSPASQETAKTPDFTALRAKLAAKEISDQDAARQVAEMTGATTPESFMAAVEKHLGWKPARAEIAAHLHFGTKDQSSIPLASGKRDASNRVPASPSAKAGPDASLAATPSALRKNRAYAADKLRVLAGIKDPARKAWARQFFIALEQSLQRHHLLYDAYAVGQAARRHLDGQMTAVLEIDGKITRLIDLDAMAAQFSYLGSPQDALRATSLEEDIHAQVLQLAREQPDKYGYKALRRKWQQLPDALKQAVWTAYRAANQQAANAAEVKLPKLSANQEWHLMNEFLRMLVQDARFAGQITETVDPSSGLLGWVQDFLRDLSKLLKSLMGRVQPALHAELDGMVKQIGDRLQQLEAASAAQADRLAVLPSHRDPAAYATTVLQQLGTAENAGILSNAALARLFDQLDPALQSHAFTGWKTANREQRTENKADKAVLMRSLLAQFLGSRQDSRRLATVLAGLSTPPKTTGLLTKVMDALLGRVQERSTLDLLAAQDPAAKRNLANLHIAALNAIGGIRAASFVHGLAAKPGLVTALEAAPVNPVTDVNDVTSETAARRKADFLAALAAREQDHEDARNDEGQAKLRARLREEEAANPAMEAIDQDAAREQQRLADFLAALDDRDRQIELDHRDAASPTAGPALRRKLRQQELAAVRQIAWLRGEALAEIQSHIDRGRLPEPQRRLLFDLMQVAAGRFANKRPADLRLAGFSTEQTLKNLGLRITDRGSLVTLDPINTAAYAERGHLILRQETLDTLADFYPAVAAYIHHRLGSEYDQRQKHGLPTFAQPAPQITDEPESTPGGQTSASAVDSAPPAAEPDELPVAQPPATSPFAQNTSSPSPSLPLSKSPPLDFPIPLSKRGQVRRSQFPDSDSLAAFQFKLDADTVASARSTPAEVKKAEQRGLSLLARLMEETGLSRADLEKKLIDYHTAVVEQAEKASAFGTFTPPSFASVGGQTSASAESTLPPPIGGDILSGMREQGIRRLGPPDASDGWSWYRELQADASRSKLKNAEAQRLARAGDITDAKAKLAWIDSNVVSQTGGRSIDEAAAELSESDSQQFPVQSGDELGRAILEALDQRTRNKEQGTSPETTREAEAVSAAQDFATYAAGVTGQPFTAEQLSRELEPEDEIQIGREWFTVQETDPLTLDSARFGSITLRPDQTLNLTAGPNHLRLGNPASSIQNPASDPETLAAIQNALPPGQRDFLAPSAIETTLKPLPPEQLATPQDVEEMDADLRASIDAGEALDASLPAGMEESEDLGASADDWLDENTALAAATRSRRDATFEPGIKTPFGTLLRYSWMHRSEDVFNPLTGEVELKRVSDWDKALTNAETGREIVHHFTVSRPDGTTQTVSLETALGSMTAEQKKSTNGIIRALRRLPVNEALMAHLKAKQAAYLAAVDEAYASTWKQSPDITLSDPDFTPLRESGIKAGYIGKTFVGNFEPSELPLSPAKIQNAKVRWALENITTPKLTYDEQNKLESLSRIIKKDREALRQSGTTSSGISTADPTGQLPLFATNRLAEVDPQRLSAFHNLSPENLAYADRMGGLAVPSIAVLPEGQAISGFGSITLIGTRDLVDPRKNPVFDADAYTARFPDPEYKRARTADAQSLVNKLRPFERQFEDAGITGTLWDNAVNNPNPQDSLQRLQRSLTGKAAFLAEQGTPVEPVRMDKPIGAEWVLEPAFAPYRADPSLIKNLNPNDEPTNRALAQAIRTAIAEYVRRTESGARVAKVLIDSYIDKDTGLPLFGRTMGIEKSLDAIGQQQVDTAATTAKLDAALAGREAAFQQWAERQILPIMGEPRLTLKGRKVPYTLNNIVQAMTSARVRGGENIGSFFGEGAARGNSATRFKDLEQMRVAAAVQIMPEQQVSAARETAKKLLADWREAVADYTTLRNWKSQPDIFGAFDAAMRAIARWAKGSQTPAALRSALQQEDFASVPDAIIEQGQKAAEAFAAAPVPYFESKPQRAVLLNEFVGAVIPDSEATGPTADILNRHGIPFRTYTGSAAQQTTAAQFAQDLADKGALFATNRNAAAIREAAAFASGQAQSTLPKGLQGLFNQDPKPLKQEPPGTPRGLRRLFAPVSPSPRLPISQSLSLPPGSSTVWQSLKDAYQSLKAAGEDLTPAQFMRELKAAYDANQVALEFANSQAEIDAARPFVLPTENGPAIRMALLAATNRKPTPAMADMQAQAAWLDRTAKARGFANADNLALKDPELFRQLSTQWRISHARDAEGKFVQTAAIHAIFTELHGSKNTKIWRLDESGQRARSFAAEAESHTRGNARAGQAGPASPTPESLRAEKALLIDWARDAGLLLNKLPEAFTPYSAGDVGNMEHHVFVVDGRMLKITREDHYGIWPVPHLGEFDLRNSASSPLRYLQRILDINTTLGDDIVLHGVLQDRQGHVQIITSQPRFEGTKANEQWSALPEESPVEQRNDVFHAAVAEVREAFAMSGFQPVTNDNRTYYRPADNTAIFDAHLSNLMWVESEDGQRYLVPFDVTVMHPAGELRANFERLAAERSPLAASDRQLSNGTPVPDRFNVGPVYHGTPDKTFTAFSRAAPRLPISPSPRLATQVAAAAAATDPAPSDAQKRAGNYAKGKVDLHGLRISIENPAGSTRSGTDASGKPWSITLPHHYGYILGSEGRDGDHVDVFIGPNPDSQLVLIINQRKPGNGHFDEHKVMLGFNTPAEAARSYMASYTKGWKGLQSAIPTTIPVFKHWLTTHDTTQPVTPEQIQKLAKTVPQPTSAHDKPALASSERTTPEAIRRIGASVAATLENRKKARIADSTFEFYFQPSDDPEHEGDGTYEVTWTAPSYEDQYLERFVPLPSIYPLKDGGFYVGDSPRKYATIAEAKASVKQGVADYLEENTGSFGANMDGKESAGMVFDQASPFFAEFGSDWFGSKWGSWYYEAKDSEGEKLKISIRDHEATRADLGLPDKAWEVSKDWDPVQVAEALAKAWTWLKANAESLSESGAAGIKTNLEGADAPTRAGDVRVTDRATEATSDSIPRLPQMGETSTLPSSPSLPVSQSPSLAAGSRLGTAITRSASAVASGTERTLQVANTLTDALGFQQPLATFGSNNLDQLIAGRLGKTSLVGAAAAGTLGTLLGGPVGGIAGVAIGATAGRAFHLQARAAKQAVETWLDKPDGLAPSIKGLVDQILPTALLPREWLALHHEMQRKSAYGQETANDLIRALSGNPRLSDLAYPKEFAENPAARAQLFDAMEGRIPMSTLPPAMQRLGERLRDLLRQTGSELVRQGLMNPDTFEELQSNGWMPRYTEDEARETAGSFLAAFKLGVRDLLQQRSTAYHIVDTTRKDKTGQFVTVSRDEGGKRNRWRFRDAASRDAFYHDFVRKQTLNMLQESGNKIVADMLAPLSRGDRAAIRSQIKTLTIDQIANTAKLSPMLAGIVKQAKKHQYDRFLPKDPFEPAKLIKDPVYAVSRYVLGQTHNAATMELLRKTAANPEWVSDVSLTGFEAIPDASRFGPLAGKHVRKDIARQILDLVDVPNAALQFYDAILRKWKAGKLVWNPGSHIRDAVGNTVFAYLGGSSIWNPGNWPYYQQAIKALREGGSDFAELVEQQVIGGDAYSGLVKERLKGLLPDPKTVENYDPGFVQRLLFGFGATLHGSHEFLTSLRRIPDDLYKSAAYFKHKAEFSQSQSLPVSESARRAADEVRKWFPYYDRLGQSGTTRAVGRFVNPFFSFFRESTRILGHAVAERPLALTTALAFPALITAASAIALGLDDDDMEEVKKDLSGKGKLFATDTSLFSMLLPVRSAQGALQQFDISAIMPFADLLGTRVAGTDANEDPWNRFWRGIVAGGPVLSLVDAWRHNEDAFTRRPIAEFGMTPLEKITAYTRHAAGVALPPLMPGGTAFATLTRAGDRSTNKTLETYDPAQAVLRSVAGLNVKNATPDLYRLADDWRKAHGYEVQEGMDYGSTTPASRARKALFAQLAQDEPNLAAIKNILASLSKMGHPVRTEQDINRLLFYKDPLKLIGGNKAKGITAADAQNQFRRSLHGEARAALDRALQEYRRIQQRAPALIRQAQ